MATPQIALFAALLFFIVSSQPVYRTTNGIFSKLGLRLADSAGNPTKLGAVVHAFVMFLGVYLFSQGRL